MKRLFSILALTILCLSLIPAPVLSQQGCPTLKLTTMTPKSGPVGTLVNYTGEINVSDSSYQIFWDSLEEGILLTEGTSVGYDLSGSFTVPVAAYGKHFIWLYGKKTQNACRTQEFKILPTLTLKPTSAPPGNQVKVMADGFPADGTVAITFDGSVIDSVTADKNGVFTATFTVPVTTSGAHTISVINNKLDTADIPEAELTVVPRIDVDNPAPTIGSKVKIWGEGFAAQSEITIKYDDEVVKPEEKNVTTDDEGSFTATIVIPNSSRKEHTIHVSDASGGSASDGVSTSVATMVLGLEKDSPPKPMPMAPLHQRFGIYGSKVVAFDWTDVEDPSGVTYAFEVARDLTFFPPVVKKKALEESNYTLATNEALPYGTYYWRVKALDNAGNESEWSVSPYPIKIGLIPLWGFIIGGLVALIIGIFLLRAILRFFIRLFRYY